MTGVGNERILRNLNLLTKMGQEIWLRIPVVPDFNFAEDFHIRCASFLSNLPGKITRVDLLPFHNWCEDKYSWLGRAWRLKDIDSLEPALLKGLAEYYQKCGIEASIGGSGFQD